MFGFALLVRFHPHAYYTYFPQSEIVIQLVKTAKFSPESTLRCGCLTTTSNKQSRPLRHTRTNSVLVIENVQQSQDSIYRRLDAKIDEVGAQAAEHGLNMFISGQLHSLLPPTATTVHLSKHQQTMCVPSCTCLCHQWQEVRSPKVFDKLMGSLLLGYTGVPLVTRKCTNESCKFKATYALRLRYQFPLWLLSHACQGKQTIKVGLIW